MLIQITLTPILFLFVLLFATPFSAKADDNGNIPSSSQYHWVLWKIVSNPQNPIGFAEGVYRSKNSCNHHIPHKTSIYGEGPKKKGYVCLLKGMKPFSIGLHRNEPHKGGPEEQPSPSDIAPN